MNLKQEKDLFSLAWSLVRDAGTLADQEIVDRLKALHGCSEASGPQRALAQGLAMAVWNRVEAGGGMAV